MHVVARPLQELTAAERVAWATLHRSEPHLRHPSLSPTFAAATAEAFDNIEVGVALSGGEPVGFLPFERRPGDVGLPLVAPLTDRQAFVARPGLPVDAPTLLRGCGLAAWRFDHLIAAPAPGPFVPYAACWDDAYEVDLTGGFDAYVARGEVASFVRQTDRKARKLAREVGPLRFEWRAVDDMLIDRMIAYKQAQLAEQGLRDPFDDERLVALLRRLHRTYEPGDGGVSVGSGGTRPPAPAFAGTLSVLWAGDDPAAIHLGLQAGDEFHSWIPAHALTLRRYSPGAVLHLEMLREAALRGVRKVDLGRGENPLKTRLASGVVPLGIGAADLRLWGRAASVARQAAVAAPFARRTVRAVRRFRARLA